jgi:hypothetical protein
LGLHENKTRLIEFGRLSTEQREARGDRRPETFAFLVFTHYCARSREGRFVVKRRTDRKRLTRLGGRPKPTISRHLKTDN